MPSIQFQASRRRPAQLSRHLDCWCIVKRFAKVWKHQQVVVTRGQGLANKLVGWFADPMPKTTNYTHRYVMLWTVVTHKHAHTHIYLYLQMYIYIRKTWINKWTYIYIYAYRFHFLSWVSRWCHEDEKTGCCLPASQQWWSGWSCSSIEALGEACFENKMGMMWIMVAFSFVSFFQEPT